MSTTGSIISGPTPACSPSSTAPRAPELSMNPLRPPDTAPDDPRLGHLMGRRSDVDPRVVLIGFPTDTGVRRNGGRPGAGAAPAEIRRHLARLVPDPRAGAPFIDLLEHTHDLGDVPVTGELEADQDRLAV